MKKTDVFVALFIIFASLFALKDLFIPGFYTSHDGPHQIVRAYYYHHLIEQGHFPPRYVFDLNWGFGYPLFIFSYHMPWLISEIFVRFGVSIIDSVKMTFLTGFIASGIFMYLYQRFLFGRMAAFVGCFIYLFSPFRFSNIFVRSAIGDATALIFAPLVFLSFDLIRKDKKINFLHLIFFGISMTALLISHAMIFFFFASAVFLYFLYRLILTKKRKELIVTTGIGFFLFVLYSSFYLLPSFFERSYTKFAATMGPLSTVTNYLSISKLIYSPWGYGTIDAAFGPMSISIGPVLLFIALLTALILAKLCLKRINIYKTKAAYGFIFLLFFLLTFFLMLPQSTQFWKFLSEYFLIDFNWRVLNLTVFAASMMAGFLVFHFKNNKVSVIIVSYLLIILALYTNRNHLRINQSLDWSVPFFLKLEKTTNSFEEYMPKWVDTYYIKENSPKIRPSDRFTYKFIRQESDFYELDVNVVQSGRLVFNILYYPGWEAAINGVKTKIVYEEKGLIEINLDKGEHRLLLQFVKTPLRQVADLVTVSSLVLTAGFYIKNKYYG